MTVYGSRRAARLSKRISGFRMHAMKRHLLFLLCGIAVASLDANAQAAKAEAHVAAAKAIASEPGLYDLTSTFNLLCKERKTQSIEEALGKGANPRARRVPERAQWYVEPVKVFDNVFKVGTEWYVWAVKTSDGIILLNAGRDYAAESVPENLQKLGLDPASVKYVILHNADPANYGAAKLFQDKYHSKILTSEADWNVIAKSTDATAEIKPRKDMVAKDGQKLTLGDTTLTMYITPGNDSGTLSTVVPLRDGNTRHVGLLVGGRDWDAAEQGVVYFPSEEVALKTWISSADRLRDIAAKANVDVFLTVRGLYDQEKEKARVLTQRKPGEPHPYINKQAVDRYLHVISECNNAQVAWRNKT
jgi:metallo-beta-lactamase class B